MIKILLKKQLTEIFKGYFFDSRKNKARTRASTILYFTLFAFLMIFVMGAMFGSVSFALSPIITLGFGWLYYAIIGLISVLFGVFGSVFSTYSGLYLAKDNDLLLSMPISVRAIMVSRLSGVYLLGLLYSAVGIVPAVVVYFITCGVTFSGVLGAIIYILLISLFVLALSCIFGFFVAKISARLKNKSFVTVLISLLFFAIYYYVYFNASNFLSLVIKNIMLYGQSIKNNAYPVYVIGSAAEGGILPIVEVSVVVLAFLCLTLYVVSHSFLKIATGSNVSTKVKYKQKPERSHSPLSALLLREFKRFTSSPNYMLNCGLGIFFMIAAGIFALIKGDSLRVILEDSYYKNLVYIGACALIALMTSMNDTAAPSVSLEGKTLWQVRSLPVDTKIVLKSKYLLEMYINIVPALFFASCLIIVLRPGIITGVLMVLFALISVVFYAMFDLYCGLHKVNLNWTNEIIPIKQGMNVMLAIFGAWGIIIALMLPYLILGTIMSAEIYMTVLIIMLSLISLLIYSWINTKGVKIFESL